MTPNPEPITFEFDRYVNGVLMAEGVTIERERLSGIDAGLIPLMAAWGSLNEIECMIPAEHWPDHEGRDSGPVRDMTITMNGAKP